VIYTCAICGKRLHRGRWGLCYDHYFEYATGTALPEWLVYLRRSHHAEESRRYNEEIPFSDLSDGEEDGFLIIT
jgi:hypothetical protein